MEERELVGALRRGDRETFANLVDDLSPSLLRLAMVHVPSRAIAEEVVQETWIGVIEGIDRFEERASLRSWICQILLNIARRRGAREKRVLPFAYFRRRAEEGSDEPAVEPDRFQRRRDPAPGAWAQPPAQWSDPAHRLSTAAARDAMLTAITKLPPRQRDVIVLRDIQGWPADEVCNALELTETNQRVLLHRARSAVRATLEVHLEHSGARG